MQAVQCNPPAAQIQELERGDKMIRRNRRIASAHALFAVATGLLAASSVLAQVSPMEIANPKLRAAEGQYFSQLQSLQQAIGKTQFRLPFILTRYVGLDPARQASLDTRGLEFVYFQNRMLLKTSGFYTAAFNAEQLTPNQRASRTFQEVIVPILRVLAEQIPPDVACDGIGFEIAYHTRAVDKNSDFEGREILAVVLDRADAFAFLDEPENGRQQAMLNRSEIYLDAKPFGLALGQKDALSAEALERFDPADTGTPVGSFSSSTGARLPVALPHSAPAAVPGLSRATPSADAGAGDSPPPLPADTERLQAQYQPQLDAFLKDHGVQFHLVDYAPPSLGIYHHQLVLQLTLRNTLAFEKSASSIYKRAAQTFDLFLAPQLKALVAKLPVDHRVDALEFSILNRLGNEKDSSEAVEFICPVRSVRSFIEDEIGGQDFIDKSLVLVNGVRINLHLELVE